jgi:uncharacterized protein
MDVGVLILLGLAMAVGLVGVILPVLPGRSLRQSGAPTSTLIPVVGLLVGAVVGIFLGELRRFDRASAAWRSTVTTLKAIGAGILVELAAGLVAMGIWLVSVLFGVG